MLQELCFLFVSFCVLFVQHGNYLWSVLCFKFDYTISGRHCRTSAVYVCQWLILQVSTVIFFHFIRTPSASFKDTAGVPVMAQQKRTRNHETRNHEVAVRSLAQPSGLRIWCCRELWCRSQTRLGFFIAVAVAQAGSYSSYQTPRLGTSICCGCGPKKQKKKRKGHSILLTGTCLVGLNRFQIRL